MNKKQLSIFFTVWSGQLIANIGVGISIFSISIYIFRLTNSAVSYSWLMLAGFLPSLLLRPLGGNLADRMDRRLLMIIGDTGSGLCILFIILMLYAGVPGLWYIYTGTIISSAFTAIHIPAYKASITDLAEEHFYAKANSLVLLAETSKMFISPVIAGFLLGYMSIGSVLFITFICFLMSVLSIVLVRKYTTTNIQKIDIGFMEDLKGGFTYLLRNKALMGLLYMTSACSFFMGLYAALLGPMLLPHTSAKIFGMIQTFTTSGLIAGSIILMTFFSHPSSCIRMLSNGFFAMGLFLACTGFSDYIYIICIAGFLFFMASPFVNISMDIMIRRSVPNAIQGRTWGAISLITNIGMIVALAIAGILADYIFNPLLEPNGLLSNTVGRIIGTGETRGIGLIFVLAGIFTILIAFIIPRMGILRQFDKPCKS